MLFHEIKLNSTQLKLSQGRRGATGLRGKWNREGWTVLVMTQNTNTWEEKNGQGFESVPLG